MSHERQMPLQAATLLCLSLLLLLPLASAVLAESNEAFIARHKGEQLHSRCHAQ